MIERSSDNHESVSPIRQPELPGQRRISETSVRGRGWTIAPIMMLAVMLALFWQFHAELDGLESRLAMETGSGERLKALGSQMNILRDRLHGLMADSVEIRLKSLERSIAAGKISGDDLLVFQTLQNDLKTLESYERAPGSPGLESRAREHPRYQAAGVALVKGDLLREISRLRTLLYLCVTGLLAAGGALAGRYWISSRRHAVLNNPAADRAPLLNGRPPSGHG